MCGGTFRGKIFFPKKVNFVSGFWSTKIWFWETTRHARKNCPYVEKRTFGATFFENLISRFIIFRSWAKFFLPSMERNWHGCEKASYVTRRPLKELKYFKVQKNKTFWIISGLERKSMKLLVLFFDTIFKIACRDESWTSKHFFWYVFGLGLSNFFPFLASIFVKGLSKM